MQRSKLKAMKGERATFRGTVERIGTKRDYGYDKPTLLLVNIIDADGNAICDHLWFNLTKGFAVLQPQPGDIVAFSARVEKYKKGYEGRRWEVAIEKPVSYDYRLSRPTKMTVVQRAADELQEDQ